MTILPGHLVMHPSQDKFGYRWMCKECMEVCTVDEMLDLTEDREGHEEKYNQAKYVCPNEDCMFSDDGNNFMKIDDDHG